MSFGTGFQPNCPRHPKENLKPEDIRSIRLICVQKFVQFVQFVFNNLKSWIICIFFHQKNLRKSMKICVYREKEKIKRSLRETHKLNGIN